MKQLYKNKIISMCLIIVLIVGLFGIISVFFERSNDDVSNDNVINDDTVNEGNENDDSKLENDSNIDNSTSVVDFTQLTYVAFGDSITQGWDGVIYQHIAKPYPTRVGESLNLRGYSNYAVGGTTFTQANGVMNINNQVANASSDFDIVSVMLGVNDYARSVELGVMTDRNLTTIYGALNTLVANLKAKYSDSFIFFITPLPCYREATNSMVTGVSLEDISSAIKVVCQANGIPVLDMYALGEFTMENDPNSDGLHPTQSYVDSYLAPKIAAFIKSNYK